MNKVPSVNDIMNMTSREYDNLLNRINKRITRGVSAMGTDSHILNKQTVLIKNLQGYGMHVNAHETNTGEYYTLKRGKNAPMPTRENAQVIRALLNLETYGAAEKRFRKEIAENINKRRRKQNKKPIKPSQVKQASVKSRAASEQKRIEGFNQTVQYLYDNAGNDAELKAAMLSANRTGSGGGWISKQEQAEQQAIVALMKTPTDTWTPAQKAFYEYYRNKMLKQRRKKNDNPYDLE